MLSFRKGFMVNTSWKDQSVLLVIRDCVPLTIIATVWHTIERDAINASRKNGASNRQWLDGNRLATRKKPPVTGVGSNQNMQLSCWCIMPTVICTIPIQPT
jgi:hypothetical protein